jgi:hypothetical protein
MSVIEQIICKYQHRGLATLLLEMPPAYCRLAAEAISELPRGQVLVTTGFYCFGGGETDGPVGTYFLCQALRKMGFSPVIVTDSYSKAFFDGVEFQVEIYDWQTDAKSLLQKYRPVMLLSVERCGRASDGKYYTMNKTDISEFTLPVDALFLQSDVLSIGIGDGGNEIGMGKYYECLKEALFIIPSVVSCDFLIPATVSNWGAYGLLTALSIYNKINLLPSFLEVSKYLHFIVDQGASDGIKGKANYSVDGFDLQVEKEILLLLMQEIESALT